MSDAPYTTCPACRKPVDPNQAGAVYAVKQADIPAFGQIHDFIDDKPAFFHPGCSPERIGYERRQLPDSASA